MFEVPSADIYKLYSAILELDPNNEIDLLSFYEEHNYSVEEAQAKLESCSLQSLISGREPSDIIQDNIVLRQGIDAGEIVLQGSTVELYISSATTEAAVEEGTMPEVASYTEQEATDMLTQLGVIVTIEREYSKDISEGVVLRASVAANEPIASGDSVTLYVSTNSSEAQKNIEASSSTPVETNSNQSSDFRSGSVNETINYTFNDGTLTLSGTGELPWFNVRDYSGGDQPWWTFRNEIISVVINEGITSTGISAFTDCKNVVSITLPDSLQRIDGWSFDGCTSLCNITIPKSVNQIDGYAFSGCSSLSTLTIPNRVTVIEDGLFYNCSNLTSIDLPQNITEIRSTAFYGCANLSSISLPDRLETIGGVAFGNCRNLTNITIPSSVKMIYSRVFEKSGLKTIKYMGSQDEWDNIQINDENNELFSATVIFAD